MPTLNIEITPVDTGVCEFPFAERRFFTRAEPPAKKDYRLSRSSPRLRQCLEAQRGHRPPAVPAYVRRSRYVFLSKVIAHLLRWNTLAGVDLSSGLIDVGESFRRKEVIEVFGFLAKVVLQHVGDVFVNGFEAGGRRAALSLLIELIIQLNFVHGSRLRSSLS
jgi:hypothetical protein